MAAKPRHPECLDCIFFRPTRPAARCLGCGSGEFFEEKVVVRTPSDSELMRMFSEMSGDDND